MPGDMEIVYAKLDRAKFHAKDFTDRWGEFLDSGAYQYTIRYDAEPPHELHFVWEVRAESPSEAEVLTSLSLIYGDMLINLRATLDYLVWQLVLASGNTPTMSNSFPCVKHPDDWGSAKGGRLAGVNGAWIKEIRDLQPFKRGNPPERHLLAVLDLINNINKHRALPPVKVLLENFWVDITGDIGGRRVTVNTHIDRPMEDGVEFFSVVFDPPLKKLDLGRYTELPLRVSFDDGLDHSDGWGYTNKDLIDCVSSTVGVFENAIAS